MGCLFENERATRPFLTSSTTSRNTRQTPFSRCNQHNHSRPQVKGKRRDGRREPVCLKILPSRSIFSEGKAGKSAQGRTKYDHENIVDLDSGS